MLIKRTVRPLFPELSWVAKEMDRLNRDLNRNFWAAPTTTSGFEWNVAENEVVISAELPGFDSENLNIALENNVLTISGDRSAEDYGDDVSVLRRERRFGGFTRSFKLPYTVDADTVSADYTNGILTVMLPRIEAEKPRKIEVQAAK